MPPKRSIARDYAMVAKPYVSLQCWKESVSLNLFDKAMNNEKCQRSKNFGCEGYQCSFIKNVIRSKDGTKSYKMATKLKKKQRGYGSDRLNQKSSIFM